MPHYSKQSEERLSTCHPDIQNVFHRVIETFDHSILCGERGKEEQNKAVADKRSTTPWPGSRHNRKPSYAVDAMPFPYSWRDLEGKNGSFVQQKALLRCGMFIGYVIRTAEEMFAAGEITAPLASGVDWDGDWNVAEHSFIDVPHFQRRV